MSSVNSSKRVLAVKLLPLLCQDRKPNPKDYRCPTYKAWTICGFLVVSGPESEGNSLDDGPFHQLRPVLGTSNGSGQTCCSCLTSYIILLSPKKKKSKLCGNLLSFNYLLFVLMISLSLLHLCSGCFEVDQSRGCRLLGIEPWVISCAFAVCCAPLQLRKH